MTFDHATQHAVIYVDGELNIEGTAAATIDQTTNELYIGYKGDGGGRFDGIIDEVRISDIVRTQDEIKASMLGGARYPLASNPAPADGSIYENTWVNLSWKAGDFAVSHDVYMGDNFDDVNEASRDSDLFRGNPTLTFMVVGFPGFAYPTGLAPGTSYYWRIDEINTDGTTSKGNVWMFTVADFILVDDFESYTDDDAGGQAIWQHWIDGFGVANNGAQVGYLLPPYAEQTIVHGGSQSMPLMYENTAGVTNSEAVLALTTPRDWTRHGLAQLSLWHRGYPASVGSFVEAPAGTYTMTGSGADIWGTADQFHFAFKTLTGAGSITAQVRSVQNTNVWAKAGVMIRETLDAGSKHAFACVTPGSGVATQGRTTTDGTSYSTNETGITAPHWVKLERDAAGNFTVSHSTNGTSWQPVANAIPTNIPMASTVYIGLALTSHDATTACQAVFSNVTTTGNVSGQWAHQDVGLTTNAAVPMYVALSNTNGAPAVVANADPDAATVDTWTQWLIPLQAFADQGINLGNVDSIAIGLGTKYGMASPGGSGTVYFDDIRLYP